MYMYGHANKACCCCCYTWVQMLLQIGPLLRLGSKCYYGWDFYYAWVQMLLRMGPLLHLGPVITLVPSTFVPAIINKETMITQELAFPP